MHIVRNAATRRPASFFFFLLTASWPLCNPSSAYRRYPKHSGHFLIDFLPPPSTPVLYPEKSNFFVKAVKYVFNHFSTPPVLHVDKDRSMMMHLFFKWKGKCR